MTGPERDRTPHGPEAWLSSAGLAPLPLLTGAIDALAAEEAALAALDTDERVVLGGARLHRARSTLLRATFTVETGQRRLAHAPWLDLFIVHAATGSTARVERAVSWQDDRLVVETVELDPAHLEPVLRGAADDSGGWYAVAATGRRRVRQAQRAELRSLIDPGHGRFVLTGELDARQARLLTGDPSLLRCALAAAAVELLTDGRRVLVVSPDPVALDEIALVIEQLHDADAEAMPAPGFGVDRLTPGVVVRVGTPALEAVGSDGRLTLDGALDRHAPGASAELGDIAAELRNLAPGPDTELPERSGGGAAPTPAPTSPGHAPGLHLPHGGAGPSLAARLLAGAGLPPDRAAPPPPTAPTAPADAVDTPLPSAAELARARAVLSEAGALRAAAEADAQRAAEAHGAARQALRRLDAGRDGHRRIDELARRLEIASAESAASAAGVGRLADAIRRADPSQQAQLVQQLLVAAEVATDRLARRDEIIVDFDQDRLRTRSLGVARSEVDRAEQALRQARDAHAEAEAHVQRCRALEAAARDAVTELAGARLRGVRIVPTGERPPSTDRAAALQHLRARYLDATVRRRHAAATAVDGAGIVLCTEAELALSPELAGQRFDHLLVEGANALDAVALCLAAARIERSLVLTVDPSQRPPDPAEHDAHHARWVATPLTRLLGLARADGSLIDHPAVLALG